MHVVRSGSTAAGTVVENGQPGIVMGQVCHVRQAFPNRLVHVTVARDGQVARKNRIGIDQDIVLAALAALKLEGTLLFRAGVRAEETRPGLDGGLVHLGRRGADPARVVLDADGQTAHRQFPGTGVFEGPEVRGGQGPDGELVPDKLGDDILFFHFAFMRRRAASSMVRILSLYKLLVLTFSLSNLF